MAKIRPTYWIAAALAAGIGTPLLYDTSPGINWGIWVAAVSIGLIVVRRAASKRVRSHSIALLGWAIVLAFAQSFTAVPVHSPLIFATVALLLGLAVTTLDDSGAAISLPAVFRAPFAALSRVALGFLSELATVTRNLRGIRARPATRGAFLALPVVLVLAALLSRADPILDSLRETLFGWLGKWSIDGRFVFFLVLAGITLGAYALAAGPKAQRLPVPNEPQLPFRVSQTETRILLGSVNAVLWLFVLLQIFSLTRDPAGTAGTGVTYAEYARRGFAELSVAAALVLVIILFTEVFRASESANAPRRLELIAILAVQVILVSAFHRVLLYESAYGFTTDRLVAQICMVVLSAAFLLLAFDLRRGSVSPFFGRRVLVVTLAAFTAFTYWNYEAWIVRKNFERARTGAELDLSYLSRLSLAAAPALVEGRGSLSAEQRAQLDAALRCKRIPESLHWYEWNLRRERARTALAALAGTCRRGEFRPAIRAAVR